MERLSGLPPELIGEVFQWLGEEDLAAVSALSPACHRAASWELARRGTVLLRPPWEPADLQSSKLVIACSSGQQLPHKIAEGVKRLGICLDEPSHIQPVQLSRLLSGKVVHLKLKNAVVSAASCESLLSCPSLERLRVIGGRVSKRGIRLLLEHRELFSELVLGRGHSGIFGQCEGVVEWWPAEVRNAEVDPNTLDALGLRQLQSLRIDDGVGLTSLQLIALSHLPLLRKVIIRGLQLPSETINEAFCNGFKSLRSLKLLDCSKIDHLTCRNVSKNINLKKLVLDFRNTQNLEQCINNLQKLTTSSLRSLIIIYKDFCTFDNTRLFSSNTSSLKTLILKNYKFCTLTEKSFKFLVEICSQMNVNFKYEKVFFKGIKGRKSTETSEEHIERKSYFCVKEFTGKFERALKT